MADEMLKAQVRVVNYLINFLKNTKEKRGKSAQTVQYLEARIKLLERYYSDLFTRHESLLPFATEKASHEYFAKDAFMFAEEAYVEALAELSADVERLRTQTSIAQSTSTAAGRPGVPASATIDHVKVPRVSLPTFTGKQTEWESYKQRFSSLIKNKAEYSDVDKLQYLLSTVEGKAAERLRGLEVTGANFKVAWDKLTKRYDNVRKRLASHLDALINLPAVRSKTLSDLEKLMDGVEVAVRGLQDLGCPIAEYDNWFVHCVARKLDAHTRETWEISQESKEGFFKYADLIDFLDRRLISLDQTYGQSEPRSTIYSSEKSNSQKFKKLNSTSVLTARVEESTFTSNNYSISCCVCQGKHPIHTCAQFKQMSPQDRFSYCKKEKLCLNCLRKGHTVSECKSSNRCLVCKQAHHTKLHFDSSNPSSSQKTDTTAKSVSSTSVVENSSDSACGAHFATASRSVLLATAKLLVCDRFGNSISARALIDPGAQRSFVTERLAALLQAEFRPVSVSILGVGGQVSSRARGEITVELKSRVDANFGCFCTALVLREVTCLLPAHKLPVKEWSHLKGLQLADPAYSSPAKIDLILGADLYSTILLDGLVRGPKNAPIAQKTTFGWILTGAIHPQDSQSETSRVTAYHVTTDATSQALVKFWEIEELPSSPKLTAEEEYCDQYFLSTYSRNAQGRFVVRLPFSRREPFPDSRDIAVACLRRSERRQLRDVELQQAYSAFMQEYVELGHMEVATKRPADSFSYYMPHHGVFRADSRKIRVVFNASQKTSSGYSLNDILLTGRKLQQDITLIILRWRFHQLAIATDIVKMFRQFLVHRDDTDWQRLVWRDSPTNDVQDLVALTVTYGTACAPYLAMMSLIQLANDGRRSHPLAARLLLDQTYIDDLFLGADDEENAKELRDQLISLLATAGLELGKWSSNRPELIQGLLGDQVLDLPSSTGDIVSTLGLKWDTGKDEFLFQTTLPPLPSLISKRSVLSDTARLFDPLGFIAPIIIQAKILLQDLWLNQLDWDTSLPRELLDRWLLFRASLLNLSQVRIPRWIGAKAHSDWHLHGFSDASARAYAAIVFAVIPGSTPSILMAKTRVAPVRVETLPRLELCGAVLLTRLAKHVLAGFAKGPETINFWTDSKIVLDWLGSHPSRWPTFVANRVSEIGSSFPQASWRHVSSKDNPADCATRGLNPQELADFSLWWTGPPWLRGPSTEWPAPQQAQALHANLSNPSLGEDDMAPFERVSSFAKIMRIVAYCRRWKTNGNPDIHRAVGVFSVRELHLAKIALFRLIQNHFFSSEIHSLSESKPLSQRNPMARLSPFLDEDGLLRVGGRLQNASVPYSERHPIILPGKCNVVRRLVEEAHRITLHGGIQLMASYLSRSYWILRSSRLLAGVYRRCLTCIRYGAPVMQQQMAPLPAARVTPARPFETTGLDYAGPFPILFSKGRGAKTTKGYVAIFICFVIKAIHVEIVSDLTSDAFLSAFSRFTARRGLPSTIYSDNGTTFKGADAELQRLFAESSMFSTEVFSQLAAQRIEWKFIPPRAPHFGGLWEAAVRSFKHHLRRVIGGSLLTFEEFSTLAAKIEACLNSRPLSPLSSDPNDLVALTPGHFLIGSAPLAFPEPVVHDLQSKMSYKSRWQLVNRLRDSFWSRWRKEVLTQLQQRNKWLKPQPNLSAGDIVIVTDELAPPAAWPLALVTATHPGKDGLVRAVTLRTAKTTFVRPVVKLLRLPPDEETNSIHMQVAAFCKCCHIISSPLNATRK